MNAKEWTEREVIDRLRRAVRKAEEFYATLESLEFAEPYETIWDAQRDAKRALNTLSKELERREAEQARQHFNRYHQNRWQQVVA